MKQNISFFTHYTNAHDHPKFQLVIAEYGYEGYGRFWALNEHIGDSEGCRLDISKRRNLAALANVLKTSPDELQTFVDFLASPDVELIHKDDGFIWTEQTQDDLDRAMKARESAKNRRVARSSTDEVKTSDDEIKTSDDEMHGQEGQDRTRQEGEEERAQTRDAPAPAEFYKWLLTVLRTERKMRDPSQFAAKVTADPWSYPDLVARFEAERSKPKPRPRASPPAKCPKCGGPTVEADGRAGHRACGVYYTYDEVGNKWVREDDEHAAAVVDDDDDVAF